MEDPTKSVIELCGIEELAEEILSDNAEIVALDKRRNSNREGIRSLMKTNSNKSWMAVGPLLIRLPSEKAKNLLEKDQNVIGIEINKLRSDLKIKVNKLRDLEYKDPIKGFNLNPMTKNEMNAVGQALGRHV